MALIASGIHGSSPGMSYEFYAEQTSGSGNNRTIKITLKLKAGQYSTSFYGYPVQWKANINGSWSGWMKVKGNESWRGSDGFRTFTYTATTNVGTSSSKSITVGIQTDSIGYTHWDFTKTGSLTVSQTNVAPTISGTVTTSPSGTFSETTSSVTVTSPQASDANGNLSGYRCQVSINGGSWTQVYSGASRTFTHNISSYGEGTSFAYKFDVYDSAGAWSSSSVTSATIYKNRFNMDSITSAGSITYSSSNISIVFAGGSNTQSGVSITRKLSCNNGITVYNPTVTTSPITLTIYKSGTAPTSPYIKFDDLKKLFATNSNKGKGTLTFTLTGTNSNGTIKTSSKVVSVNLTTIPPKVTNAIISTVQTESTNYLTVASTKNKYFIPDGSKHTRVKWDVKTGNLGEALTYQVFIAYGSGSYTKVADITSGVGYYNHVIAKQTVSQAFKYKIRAISSYDSSLYSEVETSAQTLHYYNDVGLTQGSITRTSTGADVVITIKSNSSIPNINTKGTWKNCTAGTTTALTSGNLTVAQTAQTIKITGLTDSGTYDLIVTYNDDTGFVTTSKTSTIRIGANLPVMFVNKYGVGVGGAQASSKAKVNVEGNIFAEAIGGQQISNNTNVTILECVGGGVFGTKSASHTGALKITLPQTWNNTMLKFDIEIYNYSSNNSCTYSVAGYNYADSKTWSNVSAYATGHKTNARANLPVRFGHDGAKCCIYIGEVGQVWNYPQIAIKNFVGGYGGGSTYSNWIDGWQIGFASSLGTITQTITNPHVSKVTPADIGAVASSDAVETATAGKVVKRDGAGDVNCRLVRANYQNQNTISGALAYRVNNSSDNYVRFCSDTTAIKKWLGVSSGRTFTHHGNVKTATITFDKTKMVNGVRVNFITSNKQGTDSWHYALNGKWVDGWTSNGATKLSFEITKLNSAGTLWFVEVWIANKYRETIGGRRYDGSGATHSGELNTIMAYLDHASNVLENLTSIVEYF